MEPTPEFQVTGTFRIDAGLNQDGDLTWRAAFDGLNPMEVIGLLTVVRERHLLRMVMPGLRDDLHGEDE